MEISRYPNKLKLFRRCFGYSQKKVTQLLGLGDSSILSKWEHGLTFPSIEQTFRLAQLYETEPQQLFDALWERLRNEQGLSGHHDPVMSNEAFTL
ncbi:MAG: helix-turn-helix transcriptional regulator [Chitinophagaceae bacterium]|nr:helix-turn-helix transcriptional regulator [Chitinophagaceae bacterium]